MSSVLVTRAEAKAVILVVGNAVDGFTFYGPFYSANEAIDFADSSGIDDTWLVADLWDEVTS